MPIEITKAWISKIGSTEPSHEIPFNEKCHLWFEYEIRKPIHNTVIAILLSREAIPLLYLYDTDIHPEKYLTRSPGIYQDRITICSDSLKEGRCEIALKIGYGQENLTDPNCKVLFNIVNYQYDLSNKACRYERPGCLKEYLKWETMSENRLTQDEKEWA